MSAKAETAPYLDGLPRRIARRAGVARRARARRARALRRAWLSDAARRSVALHRSAPAAERAVSAGDGQARRRRPSRADALARRRPHRIVLVNGRFAPSCPRSARCRRRLARRRPRETLAEQPGAGRAVARPRPIAPAASPSPRSTPRSSPTDSCWRSSPASRSTGRSRSSISARRRERALVPSAQRHRRLAPGSRATLIETFAGTGRYWTNAVDAVSRSAPARRCAMSSCRTRTREAIHFAHGRARRSRTARATRASR